MNLRGAKKQMKAKYEYFPLRPSYSCHEDLGPHYMALKG